MTSDLADPEHIASINRVTDRYLEASGSVRIEEYLTPLNLAAERVAAIERWERGVSAEPVFHYRDPDDAVIDRLVDAANRLQPTETVGESLLLELRRDVELLTAARDGNDDGITEVTCGTYGVPSAALLGAARDVLAQHAVGLPANATIAASEAAARLSASLLTAGLDSWRVEVDSQMSARMSVRASEHRVRVQAGSVYSPAEIDRLRVHELGTHVARAVNGQRQSLTILGYGLPGYMSTEEGLAAWHEEQLLTQDPATLRRYALRAIAAAAALEHGFMDTFAIIAEHTEPIEAFAIVQRAKRGFRRPGQPGSHVKDQVYLRGLLAVRAHLADRPEDHGLLMTGKFGLEHLPLIRQLESGGLLVEPLVTPDHFVGHSS